MTLGDSCRVCWSVIGLSLALGAAPLMAADAPIKLLVGDLLAEQPVVDSAAAELDDQLHLWLPAADFTRATGFTLKPEGLCREELCIPLPPASTFTRAVDGQTQVDLTEAAELLDLAVAQDIEAGVWCLGEALVGRSGGLTSGVAPDFAVPDRQGNIVRLSQYRGKKVLVITWASW